MDLIRVNDNNIQNNNSCRFVSRCSHLTLDIVPASNKKFLDIPPITE